MLDLDVLHRPGSPADAVRLFDETEGRGLYVGGGTIVVPAGSPQLDFLVDLSAAGLDYVRSDSGDLVLGSTVTVATLARSAETREQASGLLCTAALSVANHGVRNLATVGGNVAAWSYPTDLPVALLVLDAVVAMENVSGRREMPLTEFLSKRGEAFKKGDLIVEFRIPAAYATLSAGFVKIGRKRLDVAVVNAAAALATDGAAITRAMVALGALGPAPTRLSECESFLSGKSASEDVFEEAGRIASSAVSPRTDHRASGDYRRKVSATAVKRALMRAAGLLSGSR